MADGGVTTETSRDTTLEGEVSMPTTGEGGQSQESIMLSDHGSVIGTSVARSTPEREDSGDPGETRETSSKEKVTRSPPDLNVSALLTCNGSPEQRLSALQKLTECYSEAERVLKDEISRSRPTRPAALTISQELLTMRKCLDAMAQLGALSVGQAIAHREGRDGRRSMTYAEAASRKGTEVNTAREGRKTDVNAARESSKATRKGGNYPKDKKKRSGEKLKTVEGGNTKAGSTQTTGAVKTDQADRGARRMGSPSDKSAKDAGDGFTVVRQKRRRKGSKKRPADDNEPESSQPSNSGRQGLGRGSSTARGRGGKIKLPIRRENVLIIRKKEGAEVENVSRALRASVDPVTANISVLGVRETSNDSVVVTLKTPGDVDRLKAELEKQDVSLSASMPAARRPYVILRDVDLPDPDSDIISVLKSQNEALQNVSLTCRRKFRGGRGWNVVIETDLAGYQAVVDRKWTVGWCQSRARAYQRPLICFRCWRYGHVRRVCRAEARCGNCGLGTHEHKDCDQKSKCPNCSYFNAVRRCGFDTSHRAGSRECPVYGLELDREKRAYDGFKVEVPPP